MPVTLDTLKHKQWMLRILVFTLVTVMVWMGLSLFRSQQRTIISEDLQKLAIPLNPNIDVSVIERIEQKRAFTPEELTGFPIYRVIKTPTGEEQIVTELPAQEELSNVEVTAATSEEVSASPSPEITPSGSPEATSAPTATPSGSTP